VRLAKRLHQHTSSRKQACLLSLFSVTVLKAQGGKGDGAQTNVCCCSAEGGISSRSTPGARIAPSAKVPSPPSFPARCYFLHVAPLAHGRDVRDASGMDESS
jgi:hypothetical protein